MNFAQLPGVRDVGSNPIRNNQLFLFFYFVFLFFLFQFLEFSFLTFLLFSFFPIQLYLKKPEIISTEWGGTIHFFLLTLYNFKNIAPPPPTPRSLNGDVNLPPKYLKNFSGPPPPPK